MINLFRSYWPLLLALGVGLILRIHLLLIRGTFWFDEMFSVHFGTLPSWEDSWRFWVLETNPPLYTLFLRSYLPLFENVNEIVARAPSLLFSVFAMVLLFATTRRLYTKTAATFATFLLAFSSIHIILATETRSYSLLVCLTLLSMYAFIRIAIDREHKPWLWLILFICDLFLLYTHLTASILLVIQFLSLIVVEAEKKTWRRWWFIHGLAFIFWLPWLVPSLLSKLHGGLGSAWFFDASIYGNANLLSLILTAFSESYRHALMYTATTVAILLGIILLGQKVAKAEKKEREIYVFLILWGGFPIICSSILGIYMTKYVVIAHPALFILAGHLIDSTVNNVRGRMIAAFVGILLCVGPSALYTTTTPVFSSLPHLEYLEKTADTNTLILVPFGEVLTLGRYYHGATPITPIYLLDDNLPFEERVVRHNWHNQEVTNDDLERWLSDLVAKRQATKLFIIQNAASYYRLHDILLNHGWTREKPRKAPGYFQYFMYEFTAPTNACGTFGRSLPIN